MGLVPGCLPLNLDRSTVAARVATLKPNLGRSQFETELQVRPDDIDMNQHVHASRYLDYVLAARYDQMERCYGMSMEEFHRAGLGWVVRSGRLEFTRALGMGEWFIVRTWIQEVYSDGVLVHFEILRRSNRKVCCDGEFHYTMVNRQTGRAEVIPDWIVEKYSI
jgi:acyl-CoA thioester hydrolase/thioesterase-3